MCLGIPGRVQVWLQRDPLFAQAMVEFEGVAQACHMACVPQAEVGDYVLVHAGIAIAIIDQQAAQRVMEELERLGFSEEIEPSDVQSVPNTSCAPRRPGMRFLDEFRDPLLAQQLVDRVCATSTKPWVLMDVCGGQTHSLLRYGIEQALQGSVEFLHGPGCPVCVTAVEAIDFARQLCMLPGVTLTSFGDMLRVPGSRGSLLDARARGGRVKAVYSPLDAVRLAHAEPQQQFVFFAVGFETTAPATALAVLQAQELGLDNLSLLQAHVRVLPAMQALMLDPDCRVQGFLAAGHVCTITGSQSYQQFVDRFRVPVAVAGFEALDLLQAVLEVVQQLERGQAAVVNCYARTARGDGNPQAMQFVEQVYQVADRCWRGFGLIEDGGLELRDEFKHFDARRVIRRHSSYRSPIHVPALMLCRVPSGLHSAHTLARVAHRSTPWAHPWFPAKVCVRPTSATASTKRKSTTHEPRRTCRGSRRPGLPYSGRVNRLRAARSW